MNEDIRAGASIIFDNISRVVEEFCREEGVSLFPWYHDEATWLLRWGGNPLRQIEMSLEGDARLIREATYSLILTPSWYREDTGEWEFRDTYFVDAHMDQKESYPYIRRDEPIDIVAFKTALRKAFNDVNHPLPNHKPSKSPTTPSLEDAYKSVEQSFFPKDMIEQSLIHLKQGGPTLDSAHRVYQTQRNLKEIQKLRNLPCIETLFYRLPYRKPKLNPKSGGKLISDFIVWDNNELVEFKLARSYESSICAFDVVTRIAAENLRADDVSDEPYFIVGRNGSRTNLTISMIDKAATLFGTRCIKNGLMSANQTVDRASIYTSHCGFEVMSSLKESLGSNHIEYASVINILVEHTEDALEEYFDDTGYDHAYAFRDTLESNPCLATSYYALRILSRLNTNGRKDKSAIRSFFLGGVGNNRASDFTRFLKLCWSPKEGGFGSSPFKDANILHTRFALQIIRTMLQQGMLDQHDLGWFNPTAVFDFVLSCYSLGGFGFKPYGYPLMLTTRAGVSCVKLLETLRAYGCFPSMKGYKKKQEEYAAIESDIPLFINTCKQTEGGYSDRPKKPIETAK